MSKITLNGRPGLIEGRPGLIEVCPELIEGRPGLIKGRPGLIEGRLGLIGERPVRPHDSPHRLYKRECRHPVNHKTSPHVQNITNSNLL